MSVQRLQKLLTDSTSFLTTYDIQKSQTVVNKLKQAIELKKGELVPKKKFAFKTDKKKSLQVYIVQ
jgi:tubulin-specific chaperone C